MTDFVCLYTYEFWLSFCKIVRSSVILLLPLFIFRQWVDLFSKIIIMSNREKGSSEAAEFEQIATFPTTFLRYKNVTVDILLPDVINHVPEATYHV